VKCKLVEKNISLPTRTPQCTQVLTIVHLLPNEITVPSAVVLVSIKNVLCNSL